LRGCQRWIFAAVDSGGNGAAGAVVNYRSPSKGANDGGKKKGGNGKIKEGFAQKKRRVRGCQEEIPLGKEDIPNATTTQGRKKFVEQGGLLRGGEQWKGKSQREEM